VPMQPRAGTRRLERDTTLALFEVLGSSLDIRAVLERAYPLLRRLVPCDYGALGISPTARAEDFEWTVAELPSRFFAAYPDMAPHDFVRAAVAAKPNSVLRDEDMIARADLEANMMYLRAREIGAPLEQVMAVMLHIDERWQSGLSLYREKRRPFSTRERAALQRVTPAIANAVRNCHLFGAAASWSAAINALFREPTKAAVLVAPPANQLERTDRATALIEKWFSPCEWRHGCLPEPLRRLVTCAGSAGLNDGVRPEWSRRGEGATLRILFVPLGSGVGKANGLLLFEEVPDVLSLPLAWRALLTPREQEVSMAVMRGWPNRFIASELGCSEATVKKHMQHICDKLGVDSRTALLARAVERRAH
jgi:DNA-binding CsgD family transcriptional regulator